jgi:hypothetical protein
MRSEWHQHACRITGRDEFLGLAGQARLDPPVRLAAWADANLLSYGDPIGNVVDLLADLVAGRRPGSTVELAPMLRRYEQLYYAYKATSRNFRSLFRLRRDKYHERDRFTQADVAERTERWDTVLANAGAIKKSA